MVGLVQLKLNQDDYPEMHPAVCDSVWMEIARVEAENSSKLLYAGVLAVADYVENGGEVRGEYRLLVLYDNIEIEVQEGTTFHASPVNTPKAPKKRKKVPG